MISFYLVQYTPLIHQSSGVIIFLFGVITDTEEEERISDDWREKKNTFEIHIHTHTHTHTETT